MNQYYESTARDEPSDIAGIHVRTTDDFLPSVRGTVNLVNETVDVRTVHPDVDEVNLNYSDEIGVLDQNDRELIERLVVADEQTSYNVRTQLDATTLQATVTEATADGQVDIKFQRSDENGSTVMLTVDPDGGIIAHSWVEIQIDDSNIQMGNRSDGFEVHNTSGQTKSVAIDLDGANVTVANDTVGSPTESHPRTNMRPIITSRN